MAEASDHELLKHFAATRDEAVFATLVHRYERLVRLAARRVLRDDHLADDAFQATFLALARQAAALGQRNDPLAPWLQTVATNAALQLRRTRVRAQRREILSEPRTTETPLTLLLGCLDEELKRLSQTAREAIVLCYLQGMTQDQAAARLGVSKSTLRRRVEGGLESLRIRFRRRGLLVPLFGVVWSAIEAQPTNGYGAERLSQFSQAAGAWTDGKLDSWTSSLSVTSRALSRKVGTMSRWNTIQSWTAASLSVALLGGLGLWPMIAQSDAAEPPIVAQVQNPVQTTVPERSPGKVKPTKGKPHAPATAMTAGKKSSKPTLVQANGGNAQAGGMAQAGGNAQGKAIAIGNAGGMANAGGNSVKNSAFQGVININGREVKTNDPAEFQRLMQQNQVGLPFGGLGQIGQFNPNGGQALNGGQSINVGQGVSNSAFSGSININGKEMKTNDPAEYQRMLQQAQGAFPGGFPLGGLGANGGLNLGIGNAFGGANAGGGGFAGGNAGGFAGGNAGGNAGGKAFGKAQ